VPTSVLAGLTPGSSVVEVEMPNIEVDAETDRYLEFAARIAGLSKGAVVARLVGMYQTSRGDPTAVPEPEPRVVPIHADYEGHRTHANFVLGPGRIEVLSGPCTGTTYRTPSEAARAVVSAYKPDVSPHRNGWTFWIVTATGAPLQSLRHIRP
jgi:hypothetical protein